MGSNFDLYAYIWEKLPLILLFSNGWLIYRLIVVAGLADAFVARSMRRCQGRPRVLALYIIVTAALLSFFIPNAVTVLAMLPMLKTLNKEIAQKDHGVRTTTALTLSTIYGANIGGMGSLIGSPANLLLLGALDLYAVPGREQISFFNWFIWAAPLVIVFCAAAWMIVAFLLLPGGRKSAAITPINAARDLADNSPCSASDISSGHSSDNPSGGSSSHAPNLRPGFFLFIFFLFFWITHGILKEAAPAAAPYEAGACILYFIIFLLLTFVAPLGARGAPMLRPGQIMTDLPKRGIFFLGVLLLIIVLVRFFHLDERVGELCAALIPRTESLIVICFCTALSVIFLTEIFSNTVVSTLFFPIAYFTAVSGGFSPIPLMIVVSAASTCAFMTPIATPCNALAHGEMKGSSFRWMFILGLLLNIIGALLMTAWLPFAVSLVYGK
ncbi:MAG: SLC13 family permease [Desulfobacterales bacterium]|nr:SLC13 family permease [Desulfobacterales bacterium]